MKMSTNRSFSLLSKILADSLEQQQDFLRTMHFTISEHQIILASLSSPRTIFITFNINRFVHFREMDVCVSFLESN